MEGFIAQVKQVATLAELEKRERQQRGSGTREADEQDELRKAIASRRGSAQFQGPSGSAAGASASGDAGGGEGGEKIVVVVSMGEKGTKHEFRLSVTDKMAKVYAAMKERVGCDRAFTLNFDSERLNENHTPQDLDMEDKEVIDFYWTK